jgi:hypothetical protein
MIPTLSIAYSDKFAGTAANSLPSVKVNARARQLMFSPLFQEMRCNAAVHKAKNNLAK